MAADNDGSGALLARATEIIAGVMGRDNHALAEQAAREVLALRSAELQELRSERDALAWGLDGDD